MTTLSSHQLGVSKSRATLGISDGDRTETCTLHRTNLTPTRRLNIDGIWFYLCAECRQTLKEML